MMCEVKHLFEYFDAQLPMHHIIFSHFLKQKNVAKISKLSQIVCIIKF